MPLRDLFRSRPDPEWKHPDVNVRLAALRQLGSDDQELVRSLAQEDPAPQVRRAAVRKIKDGTVLAALLAAEKDDSVRDEACATRGSEHRDVAVAAVERVADTDALNPIAARAKSKAAARRARARIAVLSESAASASPQDRRRRQLRIVESLEALGRNNDWDR